MVTNTETQDDIPSSCLGGYACESATSFPIKDVTVWVDGGGSYTQGYYSGNFPPVECGSGCDIESSRVRILFWPVDENDTNIQNVSESAGTLPYTTVSDGFTL